VLFPVCNSNNSNTSSEQRPMRRPPAIAIAIATKLVLQSSHVVWVVHGLLGGALWAQQGLWKRISL
jgi:hypothetical protein